MSVSRRIGKFYVSRSIVDESPEMVMPVMARCVIVECQLHYIGNRFEYFAVSPDFDEVPLGMITPEYSVLIEMIDDLPVVTFKRISA